MFTKERRVDHRRERFQPLKMSSEKATEQRVGEIEAANNGLNRLHDVDLHDKALNSEAFAATTAEHSYGFVEGIKTYRRAAIWSVREWIPRHRQLLRRITHANASLPS
jgi:hypothetical protein